MTQVRDVVVRRQIVVDASPEKTFEVFTSRFGDFKPPEHNLLSAPIAETVYGGWPLYLNRYAALFAAAG